MDYFERMNEVAKGGGDYSKSCHKEEFICETCHKELAHHDIYTLYDDDGAYCKDCYEHSCMVGDIEYERQKEEGI